MKAKTIGKKLLRYPNYKVAFAFKDEDCHTPEIRLFDDLDIVNINHDSKLIIVSGDEY